MKIIICFILLCKISVSKAEDIVLDAPTILAPAAAFEELISYVQSCPLMEAHRQFRDTAKAEADWASYSTTQSFLPRARLGRDERESSDQLDTVNVMRIQGTVSLNEVLYGYKVADLESKSATLNANIKIYEGIDSIVRGFFKWRALSRLKSQLDSINQFFARKKMSGNKKLSYAELTKRTDAMLIRARLSGYQTQISFFEKLFANCSKKSNLKDPWEINVSYKEVAPEIWSESLGQQAKNRMAIEKMNCQARSDLRGQRIRKEKNAWLPKFYYGWAKETGSKFYSDRTSWNVGVELSIPLPGESVPTVAMDECRLRLQQESIRKADQTELAKQQVQELMELNNLRDRWSELMKQTLSAFRLEENGNVMMASALSQFERLNLQVADLEADLALSTLGTRK